MGAQDAFTKLAFGATFVVACAFNGLVAHEALTRQALGATVRVAGAPAGGEAHVFT